MWRDAKEWPLVMSWIGQSGRVLKMGFEGVEGGIPDVERPFGILNDTPDWLRRGWWKS